MAENLENWNFFLPPIDSDRRGFNTVWRSLGILVMFQRYQSGGLRVK